jgi:tRNA and rRNA cytosine-C5-methylases
MARRRASDPARTAAFRVLRAVTADGAYANLELARQRSRLSGADAAFATELAAGTCRGLGTYDEIISVAAGRPLRSLQPAVLDVLRLGTHQLLAMRVPTHAAIAATVDLAALQVGERVTGVVNAVLRRVAEHELDVWLARLGGGLDELGRLGLAHQHPRWIVEAFAELLPADELEALLTADNQPPVPNLVIRPGLAEVAELGGVPARYSPFGAYVDGDPAAVPAIAQGRAGVQDEGSQLVSLVLSRVEAPAGPWLDLCAGPGGKSALLAGLAIQQGRQLVASEVAEHRAGLVAQNLRGYAGAHRPVTLVADGTRPAWAPESFAAVLADVPCTGLGALRRRPESRWRRQVSDLGPLVELQHQLLASAIAAARTGGVIGYVTCSPHAAETAAVVADADGVEVLVARDYLPEVADAAVGPYLQLWPHRHGTDAMFLALLRKRAR